MPNSKYCFTEGAPQKQKVPYTVARQEAWWNAVLQEEQGAWRFIHDGLEN